MDDILGVVQHYRLEAQPLLPLVREHRLPNPVEAVGLRRAAGHGPHHQTHSGIADGANAGDRLRIVGIAADIDAIAVVLQRGERAPQHVADHVRFVPGGHEDGHPAGTGRRLQPVGRRALEPLIDGSAPPERPRDPDQVNGKVAEPEHEKAAGGEQGHLAHGEVDPPKDRGRSSPIRT